MAETKGGIRIVWDVFELGFEFAREIARGLRAFIDAGVDCYPESYATCEAWEIDLFKMVNGFELLVALSEQPLGLNDMSGQQRAKIDEAKLLFALHMEDLWK